jgi:hypothetical protein
MLLSFENNVVHEVIKTQYFIILFDNCQGFHTESPPPIPPSESIPLLHKIIFFPSESETDFHIFVQGVDKYLGGGLLLALAGAWWQRPEKPRKKFNEIFF